MGRAVIKVIKKGTEVMTSTPSNVEKTNTPGFTRKTAHKIEDNIKGWIEELKVRKHDDLLQAHSFMSGF